MSIAQHIERQVSTYLRRFPDDRPRLDRLIAHLADDAESLTRRSCMRGHVTSSAITLSPDLSTILEIWHRALGRWLQPGGHYEAPGTLFENAVREDVEETGVRGLRPFRPGRQVAIDVDTHPIPANPARSEGAHLHHDFAYLLVAGSTAGLTPQLAEVDGIRWTPRAEFATRDERAARIARRIDDAVRRIHGDMI